MSLSQTIKDKSKPTILHIMMSFDHEDDQSVFQNYIEALSKEYHLINISGKKIATKKYNHVTTLSCGHNIISLVKLLFNIIKIIVDNNPAVLVIHGRYSVMIVKIAQIFSFNKSPLIAVRYKPYRSKKSPIILSFLSTKVITSNRAIMTKTGNKAICINDGIPISEECENKNHFFKFNDKLVIGFAGKLVKRNGLKVLLQAMKILNFDMKIDCALTIYSLNHNNYKKKIRTIINNFNLKAKVDFIEDDVNFNRRDLFFSQINLFCFPQTKGNISQNILRAMAKKIPVIASNIEGIDDFIHHQKTGLLFDNGNAKSLAAKIKEFATNLKLREECVNDAFVRCKSHFSVSRFERDILDTMRSIISFNNSQNIK